MDLTAEVAQRVTHLSEILGSDQITVTDDHQAAVRALSARRCVALILPPTISFQTWDVYELQWETWMISPEIDPRKSTARLAPFLSAWADASPFDRAVPETYEPTNSDRAYHGYLINEKE